MLRSPLGNQELEVLRYVCAHAPATVGQAAEGFGAERGLARTTVQTVMERLCLKGYLQRSKEKGVYRYVPSVSQSEVLRGLVREFVGRTLGGSLQPFVAYLTEEGEPGEAELVELREWLRGLEGPARGERDGKEGREGKEHKKKRKK